LAGRSFSIEKRIGLQVLVINLFCVCKFFWEKGSNYNKRL
jgi:hypothetical protein